jgi:hypothetical protein
MIKIKEIDWVCKKSGWTEGVYYTGSVEHHTFIMIPEVDKRFYIHPTSYLIKVKGNKGIEEWGWFDDVEQAKKKAEELIKESILFLIDTRDYNINTILN